MENEQKQNLERKIENLKDEFRNQERKLND
jgi:hypothetical protein